MARMRMIRALPAALLLLMTPPVIGCSDPTGAACSQADTGTPCNIGDTAVRGATTWSVTVRRTRTDRVEYTDGGFQCTKNRTSCETKGCVIVGVTGPRVPGDSLRVIANCRESSF